METRLPTCAGAAPAGLILKTLRDFRHLRLEDPIAFFELVARCKDSTHQYYRDTASPIFQNELGDRGGFVEPLIAEILLAAILEDDDDIVVVPEVLKEQN